MLPFFLPLQTTIAVERETVPAQSGVKTDGMSSHKSVAMDVSSHVTTRW